MKFIEKRTADCPLETPPRYLYKYYGNLKYAIDVIENKRIHLEIPSEYNDVFDSSRVIDNEELDFVRYDNQIDSIVFYTSRDYKEKVFSLLKNCQSELPYLDDVFKYLVQNDIPLTVVDSIKALFYRYLKNAQAKNNKITCFSQRNDSLLMWAHYGKNLSGACLCFDTSKDIELFRHICSVDYSMLRNRERNYNFYFSKAQEWEYEQEWRLVVQTRRRYVYTDSCVGIILGERMPFSHNPTRNKRGELYPSFSTASFLAYEHGLDVYKAVSNNLEFKIDIEKWI